LQIRKGRVVRVDLTQDRCATVTIIGASGMESLSSERVINCTGPNLNYRTEKSPLLKSLFARGSISSGPLGLGLRTDANGAMIDAIGQTSRVFFTIGPARMGTLIESIAVPELRRQALELARVLCNTIAPTK
jgi:hydroxyacylglutathione hydrolase